MRVARPCLLALVVPLVSIPAAVAAPDLGVPFVSKEWAHDTLRTDGFGVYASYMVTEPITGSDHQVWRSATLHLRVGPCAENLKQIPGWREDRSIVNQIERGFASYYVKDTRHLVLCAEERGRSLIAVVEDYDPGGYREHVIWLARDFRASVLAATDLRLDASGFVLPGMFASWTTSSNDGQDVVRRVATEPEAVRMSFQREPGTCAAMMSGDGFVPAARPAYVPPTFHGHVRLTRDRHVELLGACLPLPDGSFRLTLVREGTQDLRDMPAPLATEVRALLAAFAHAAGVTRPAPPPKKAKKPRGRAKRAH